MSFRIRHSLCLAATLLAAGCGDAPGLTVVKEDPSDLPLADLSDEGREVRRGRRAVRAAVFRDVQGLGPLYIRQSCASCHADDARGPGAVLKMVLVDGDGATLPDQSALPYGHTVRPQIAAGASDAIVARDADGAGDQPARRPGGVRRAATSRRSLDSEIERVEAEQAARTAAISAAASTASPYAVARPTRTRASTRISPGDAGLIGRFGLKARIATLDDFTADAFQGDMGITSPLRPEELPNPDGLADDAAARRRRRRRRP